MISAGTKQLRRRLFPENDRRHLVRRSCGIIAGAKWVKSPTIIFNYGIPIWFTPTVFVLF